MDILSQNVDIFNHSPQQQLLNRSSGLFFETCSACLALFLDNLNHEIFSKNFFKRKFQEFLIWEKISFQKGAGFTWKRGVFFRKLSISIENLKKWYFRSKIANFHQSMNFELHFFFHFFCGKWLSDIAVSRVFIVSLDASGLLRGASYLSLSFLARIIRSDYQEGSLICLLWTCR